MLGENQKITKADLNFIRSLEDFDLKMLLSEIHDNGWSSAKKLMPLIKASIEKAKA